MIDTIDGAASRRPLRSSWYLLRRLYAASLGRHVWIVLLSLLCMAVIAGMASAYTYLMGPLVDRVFIGKDASMLLTIGGAVVAIFVVRSVSTYIQGVLLTSLGQNIVLDLQQALMRKLVAQDAAFHDAHPPEDLASAFIYDVGVLRTAICNFFLRVGKDCMTIAGMVGLLFYTSTGMAIFSVALLPLSLFPMMWLGRRLRWVSLCAQTEVGQLNRAVAQAFRFIHTVRAYGLEDRERRGIGSSADRVAGLLKRTTRIEAAILPVFDALGGIAIAGVAVYGGMLAIAGSLTPGKLLVVIGAVYGAYHL